jgi:predicted secreted hydrolase
MQSAQILKAFSKSSTWRFFLLVLVLTLSLPGRGEGEGVSYQLALPGKLAFPADHYSHPEFKTEEGHGPLESERASVTVIMTFFCWSARPAVEGKTTLRRAYGPFPLYQTSTRRNSYWERITAVTRERPASRRIVTWWNEDWKVDGNEKNHQIQVNDRGTELRLRLVSLRPPVLHGQNGLSQKGEGEGRASYYYSLTRMKTEGELTIDGKREKVRGVTWMDHESQ